MMETIACNVERALKEQGFNVAVEAEPAVNGFAVIFGDLRHMIGFRQDDTPKPKAIEGICLFAFADWLKSLNSGDRTDVPIGKR